MPHSEIQATPPSRAALIAFAAVVLLHLTLVYRFAPPRVIFSNEPVFTIDYPLHYYQVDRANKAHSSAGKLWGYDPLVLAGQPAGALEDISSKSLELFVIGLSSLGVHQALAFNLYVLLVHLLLPFVIFLSARCLDLTRWQAVCATCLGVGLWFFDSTIHWFWYCGMISWAAASYLTVLLIALLYRAIGQQRPVFWVATGLLACLLALLHPFAALTLIIPCAALYLQDLRRLRISSHVALFLAAGIALTTSLIWLLPALRMKHYMLQEETFLRPTIEYLLLDFLDLMKDDQQTGHPVRTMIRTLCLASAAICLVQWRKDRDRRFLPLSLLIGVCLIFAYLGGYLPLTRMSQPYRQIGPAAFGAVFPAAVLLTGLLHPRQIRTASRPIKLLLLLALLLVVPRLVRNVLYYFPDILPPNQVKSPGIGPRPVKPSALAGMGEPRPSFYQHHGTPALARQVRQWLVDNLQGKGRVVVQEFMMGEYLAATSNLPILGGLRQRSLHHGDAHLFRLHEDGDLPGDALKEYLERYAVRYVVVTAIKRNLEWRKDLLKFVKLIGPIRIYQTLIEPSYFLEGRGRIARQELNRIVVTDAKGPEVVIRFHWMETLRCKPDCRVQRHHVKGDRVGFIRIADPPPRFEIFNSYRFE